jgi:hypothetical protein
MCSAPSMRSSKSTSRREARWLLLIHQIPPKPNYLRVKIGRRLQKIGAVAVKNSVYALPNTDECQEQFTWVAREVADGGGDSSICESDFVGDRSNDGVEELFNAARAADLEALAVQARALKKGLGRKRRLDDGSRAELEGALARIRKQLADLVALDFFGAPGRQSLDAILVELEARLESPGSTPTTEAVIEPRPQGRRWVTRKSIHVDRMASAWLIRGFIDSAASFKFVPGKGYAPEPGELRFDMFEAEYTHQGDCCTFEVLLSRFDLTHDAALVAVAEVVHDIDLRDSKFARRETAGVERLVAGIAAGHDEDEARLAAACVVFQGLYEGFKRRRA